MLHEHKWNLLGSAGTAKYLNENGIPCRDVAELVGPPILGHRVVTLAREIYAGLLATDADADELKKLNLARIDLVYVTLYPLEKTIADPKSTSEQVLEKTDIGGPTFARGGQRPPHRAFLAAATRWVRTKARGGFVRPTLPDQPRSSSRAARCQLCRCIGIVLGKSVVIYSVITYFHL